MKTYSIFVLSPLRYLVVVALSATLFGGCKKEAISETPADPVEEFKVAKQRNASFFYFGATWCYACGQSGKPTMEYLAADPKNKNVAFVNCHINDYLSTTEGNTLSTALGISSFPQARINNQIAFFSSDLAYSKQQMQQMLDNVANTTPVCNTEMSTTIADSKIKIDYKTKFWEADVDSLYINILALESRLRAEQYQDASSQIGIHDCILRAQTSTNPFGDLLTIKAGKDEILKKSSTIPFNTTWKKENMQLVAVVWLKKQGKYTVINTDKIKL